MGHAYHFVDSLNNLQHLIVADLSISINIVQLESPVQLILCLAPARNAQGADELLEVDAAGPVTVKDIEDVVGERGRIAEGEELSVDLLELLFAEHARGAVLQEA